MFRYFFSCFLSLCVGHVLAQAPNKQQYPILTCAHLELPTEISTLHAEEGVSVADRSTVNNLCITYLLCSDALLTVNSTVMNSISNSCNNWLTNSHNPLPGPDYQITGYQVITMPPNVTLSDDSVIDLTLAGNPTGSQLLDNVGTWKLDIGNTDLTVVVVPNNAGSGYNPGVAFWGIGDNLIGTELGVAVLRSASTTFINLSTLLLPHEVFGHLQGLDFSATNPGNAPHSNQSCNGSTDFINAAPNNLQICSDAAAQIALAPESGPVICSGTLPVELLRFEAKQAGTYNTLSWTTLHEHDLERYDIQKSTDGSLFHTIGTETANNYSHQYTYNWDDRADHASASCYYRLRIVEHNGQEQWSPVVAVVNNSTAEWGVKSTAFDSEITIQWPDNAVNCMASLYNSQGMLLQSLASTSSPVEVWQVPDLPAGVYWLWLYADGVRVVKHIFYR
jgi:hypothetical protein